jgi:uncharacterized membrane protein
MNKIKIKYIILVILTSFFIFPFNSFGKKSGKKSSIKNTVINFDDELVIGENQKPELFYLLQKKQYNYKKLIKLREHFLPEMRNTKEDYNRDGRID